MFVELLASMCFIVGVLGIFIVLSTIVFLLYSDKPIRYSCTKIEKII